MIVRIALFIGVALVIVPMSVQLRPAAYARSSFTEVLPKPGLNPAIRILDQLSTATTFEGSDVSINSISDRASDAIAAWASQRQLPMSDVETRGRIMSYRTPINHQSSYVCFQFKASKPKHYMGLICVGDDGKLLGESSSVR